MLPRWLGWLSAVTAAAVFANGMVVTGEVGPGFLLFLLWTAITGVVLAGRPRRAPATAASAQPAAAG